MMVETKTCAHCGKPLPVDAKGNVKTHGEGECRAEHVKEMMRRTNASIKKQRVVEILKFLDKKFGLDIDVDGFAGMLVSINFHNIPLDDFVMTAYYFTSKARATPLTIASIESAASEWDAINGFARTKKHVEKINEKIAKLEKTVPSSKDHEKRLQNSIRKCKRMAENPPKIGFNKNAYRIVSSKITVSFCNMHERIRAMIENLAEKRGFDDNVKKMMIDCYNVVNESLVGKNQHVIVAGLLRHVSSVLDLGFTVKEIARDFNVSEISVERMHSEIAGLSFKSRKEV